MESTAEETSKEAAPRPAQGASDWLRRFLHVLVEPRSYLNALYLLIAFPLGLTYFVVLLGGAITGALVAGILIGLLILLAVLVAAWGFALLERELAIWLLGVDVPPLSLPDPELVSPWRMLVRHLRKSTTWRSIAYLIVKLPFGIFATSVTLALAGPPIVGILYPVFRLLSRGPVPESIGLLILPGIPAVLGLAVALQVLNFIGRTWGRFAADMLGVSEEQRQIWDSRRKAEVADRSRRELIMNVSHELRTPIASIQAHVDSLLLPEGDRPDAEETERRLRVTAAETRRLADLVQQVVLALAPLALQERQVTVTLEEIAPGLWAVGDPDRLAQVLTNLVRNAINYTPEGGVVSIRLAGGVDRVQIAVSDTGLGISAEDLEHVFERFYRADTSRTRDTGGFGLGLSIAREFVEAMGGSLSATSQPGLGSTFWISLRRAEPT